MSNQINIFRKNIESVLCIDSIYQYMESQVTAFDITELLRAEFVLIVSALDFYIHEIVREGLLHQLNTSNNCNKNSICIPLTTVKVLLSVESENEQIQILNEQIKTITSKDSYQAPRAIEKALNMININKIWTKVGEFSGKSAEDVRDTLALIINRRNKIAHEADFDSMSGEKIDITSHQIKDCIEFTTMFVEAIDQIFSPPDNPS